MQRILSTYLYIEQRLTPATLTEIERAGFNGVQIFCSGHHFNYRDMESVREFADWFRDHKLKLDSLHRPTSRDFASGRESSSPLSICDPERSRRLDAVDEFKRAIDVAEHAPFSLMVMHLGGSRIPIIRVRGMLRLKALTVLKQEREKSIIQVLHFVELMLRTETKKKQNSYTLSSCLR